MLKKIKENYYINRKEKILKVREYRQKNKDLIKVKKRIAYLKNREVILKNVKDYYSKNKDKILLASAVYRKNNLEKIRIKNKNRESLVRTLSRQTDINNDYLRDLIKDTKNCPLCGIEIIGKGEKHIDHIKPIGVGGEHKKENIRIICRKCNLSRPKDGRDIK